MSIKSRIQKSYDKGWTLDEESFKKRLKTVCKEFGIPDPEVIKFHSLIGEEKYIIQYVLKKKIRNGVFLEVGACDGVRLSNTKTLEDYFGFSGILIEPQDHYFKALKKNRPNCELYNTAVSSSLSESVVFNNIGELAGIKDTNSTNGFILKETFLRFLLAFKFFFSSLKHKEFYKKENLRKVLKNILYFPIRLMLYIRSLFKNKISYKIKNMPMSEILKKSRFKYIDIMIIDVEGGELDLLKSIDFSFPIFCMIIEIADSEERHRKIQEFLIDKDFLFIEKQDLIEKHGLIEVRSSLNSVWVNPNYFRRKLFNI